MIACKTLLLMGLLCLTSCASPRELSAPASVPMSELVVDLLDGGNLDLTEGLDAGRPVVLVFWQSWCVSCLEEAPALIDADRRYGDRLQIVGVVSGPDESVDAAKLQAALESTGMTYPQVRDRDLSLTRALDVQGTPTIIVLGPQGDVRYRGRSVPDWATIL
jgi:thiol-disulfide isomerase/thioredoxin